MGLKRCGHSYEDRNAILKELGFGSYRHYLNSDIWRIVREMVFRVKGRKCFLCGREATQIHHNRYHVNDLIGKRLKYINPVCRDCHEEIEFRDGKKSTLRQAAKSFRQIRRQHVRAIPEAAGYIVRKGSVVHIWDGQDTACRMASTGGLKPERYRWQEHKPDERICSNCTKASERHS